MTEKKPSLSRADRAKLRRLQKAGKITHRWGDKWTYDEAQAALAAHRESRIVTEKKS